MVSQGNGFIIWPWLGNILRRCLRSYVVLGTCYDGLDSLILLPRDSPGILEEIRVACGIGQIWGMPNCCRTSQVSLLFWWHFSPCPTLEWLLVFHDIPPSTDTGMMCIDWKTDWSWISNGFVLELRTQDRPAQRSRRRDKHEDESAIWLGEWKKGQ